MHIVKTFRLSTVTILIGSLAAALPAHAEGWAWSVVPYAWLTDIGLDLFVNDDPVIGADIGFSDLMDKKDAAMQLHFEGQRGRGGFFFDVTILDVSSARATGARPPLPGDTQIESDLDTTLAEAGGFYRLSGDTHGLDLIFGARMLDLDLTVDFALPPPLTGTQKLSGGDTFTDGFAGLRYPTSFANRWEFMARGDVGAGDSDLAWNASAYFGYTVGKEPQNLILFGYRHLQFELKDSTGGGQRIETDLTFSGPAIGFAFRF
jgi:hypothetical protein